METKKVNPEKISNEQLFLEKHEKSVSFEDASFHENSDTAQTLVASVKRKKHHRAWTLGEVLKLVEGVSRYGAGRWSQIRQVAFDSYSHRTSVDLKDKWRNLLKASTAQLPADEGAGRSRKPSSLPIPAPILRRIRELASKHSEPEVSFGSCKAVNNVGIVDEKEMDFL